MGGNNFTPCGRKACHAAVRMVIGIAPSVKAAARMSGVSYTTVDRIYDDEEAPRPKQPNAPRRLSERVIRAAWADTTRDHRTIAASLNISGHSLYESARRLNLPPRKAGRLKPLIEWPDDFEEMWAAGVWCKDIAGACRRPPMSSSSVTVEARKRGLKPRGPGPKINGISLLQYLLKKDAAKVRAATKAVWFGAVA